MTNGITPLFIAAQEGHLEVVRALMKAGADVAAASVAEETRLYSWPRS